MKRLLFGDSRHVSSCRRKSRYSRRHRRLLAEQLEARVVLAANPIISEFVASNSGGLRDVNGESSDWLEIYNPSSSPVDLNGWTLTDDAGELDKWTFPSVTIEPNDYLVVFASGIDRSIAGEELSTGFKLSSDGEYLALVKPGGEIASQFDPSFPEQATNVSYGIEFDVQNFVEQGSAATVLVPSSANDGSGWMSNGFDDSGWTSGTVGVGYGVDQPGFNVRYVKAKTATGFDGHINNLTEANLVLGDEAFQSFVTEDRYDVINFHGTDRNGNFGSDSPFPTQSAGDDINEFVIEATASIAIPADGDWSFGVNSDDGFRLTLTRGADVFSSQYTGSRGAADTLATFNLQAGIYELNLVTFEGVGGSSAELFAAAGNHTSFNSSFSLVGDTASGGLGAFLPYVVGESDVVNTDISSEMNGVNSSAYVRVPFTYDVAMPVESLVLKMRYDDGFVAYLNGVEVARQNAPAVLGFDTAATNSRPIPSVRTADEIVLDAAAIGLLVDGTNVLAIHGLNDFASDASFLVLPELTGSKLLESQPSYFATPTPGAANTDAVLGVLDRVTMDVPAGFYTQAQTVTISLPTASPAATIRYTTDGSEPTVTNGTVYTGPINVSSTTNLRANAYATDYVSLPSVTRTYLFLDDVLTQSNDGLPPAGWPSTWNTNDVDYGMDPDVITAEGAQAVKDALLALPTWSISTDLDNLFDAEIGIYSNALQDGRDWERPAAVELINPDGTAGFQVNAGLRIRGGYSRRDFNPKHALKLFFRGSYGDSTLNYPVHGTDAATEFEKIDLRTAQNYSWSSGGNASNNFIAEVLARYNQRDLGQPYTRSSWMHLYLNGQYWGLYQTQERADANYAVSYFGGNVADYDVIKPERGDYRNIATDGNFDAYEALWEQSNARAADGVTPAFVDNAAYLKAQGKNLDGTDNPAYDVLLDTDNVIAYMIETLRGGNLDAPISNFLGNDQPNNYFAIRDRTGREGFRFFQHDGEHTMRNVNQNRNGPWNSPNYEGGVDFFNPQWLHQQLMANEEYRIQFADKVQQAFFNDGTLSTQAMIDKVTAEAAIIHPAILAESVRWGDAQRPDAPLGINDFDNAIAGLVNNYLPQRNAIVLDQFRNTNLVLKDANGEYNVVVPAPLFPNVDAPQFLVNGTAQHGGDVVQGSQLDFSSSDGVVYYMLDGSDPRMFGGELHPDALSYSVSSTTSTVVPEQAVWRYLDTGVDAGTAWKNVGFDDSGWAAGAAKLGYGDGDEATEVSYGPDSNNKYITSYFRNTFSVDMSNGMVTNATLRLKRDDGAAVYINGVEAVRSNLPTGTITSQTKALVVVGGANEDAFFEFQINPALLQDGGNTLAVEVHQFVENSSDLAFDANLVITQQIAPSIAITKPIQVAARFRDIDGTWSAIERADFVPELTPASSENLRVTELHFNPVDGDGNTEFVELRNISGETISLAGVTLTSGVTFSFDGSPIQWLESGATALIVQDTAAMQARYGTDLPIAGEFFNGTALSNGGEAIEVTAADGSTIQSFTYDDKGGDWHSAADGEGPSLTIIRTAGDYNLGTNWRPSFVDGGTPGVEENDAPDVVLPGSGLVSENSPGDLVAVLSADDPDDFETTMMSLLPGGDSAMFSFVNDELRVGSTGLNFESSSTRSVTIRVTDSQGATLDHEFVITVQDVNEAPLANAGGPYSTSRGMPVELSASMTDVDAGQTHTFEWDFSYDGSTFSVDATGQTPITNFATGGNKRVAVRVTDNGTPAISSIAETIVAVANVSTVMTRGIAYANATAGNFSSEDIAPDIVALRPGQTATFANYTSYLRGLNRIVIDIAGLTATELSLSDFQFKVGNASDVSSWSDAPAPDSISVVPSGGVDGSSRVIITWANGAIRNQWLQTTVLASGNAQVASDDVFYFGNQVGDVDGFVSRNRAVVNAGDTLFVRANQSTRPRSVDIANNFDIDRSGNVNAADTLYVRGNQVSGTGLIMIAAPVQVAGVQSSSVVANAQSVPSVATSAVVLPASEADPIAPPSPRPQLTVRVYVRSIYRGYSSLRRLVSQYARTDRMEARAAITEIRRRLIDFRRSNTDRSLEAVDEFFSELRSDLESRLASREL
ncbi:lamin tail domain-containing protein [Planctomycetes bacterium CA13]|uniref:lamin tail domain-containing protein n=1 Tax=Novipirellula herctigrandis TaxID=2527986 RepID=UPI0011B43C2F